jgi:hypothetical protein
MTDTPRSACKSLSVMLDSSVFHKDERPTELLGRVTAPTQEKLGEGPVKLALSYDRRIMRLAFRSGGK